MPKIEIELADLLNVKGHDTSSPLSRLVGKKVLVRTVTMIYAGVLKEVSGQEMVLTAAVWVPQTKRWAETVVTGEFEECEPYPEDREVFVNRGTLLDAVELPSYSRIQK